MLERNANISLEKSGSSNSSTTKRETESFDKVFFWVYCFPFQILDSCLMNEFIDEGQFYWAWIWKIFWLDWLDFFIFFLCDSSC